MESITSVLYVTFVEKEGAFLKIWGQIDRNIPIAIEKTLAQLSIQFEQGAFIPPVETLRVGLLVCAKYKDGMYYRARITNTTLLHQGLVELQFLDYGNKDLLPYLNTRSMNNNLICIPPQARDFILAHVTHQSLSCNENILHIISNEIRYLEFNWLQLGQIGHYILIKLMKGNEDLASNLIARRILVSIPLPTQQMILQSYINGSAPLTPMPIMAVSSVSTPVLSNHLPATTSHTTPTFLTYKALTLEPGTEHEVYVSYVSDGPLQFSVQLKKMETSLAKLMGELNQMPLQPLEENPLPGTVCVARCLEDGYICRAVITSMVDGHCKVFYVDFGNIEIVPLDNLYQIPFKFVIPKVMAMRFCLTGLESSNVTIEMKCVFKEYVSNRQLLMRVAPTARRTALQFCDLWDKNHVNILNILKRAAILSYPESATLNRGLSQEVHVSYVYSCNRFFVQLKNKLQDLEVLMSNLQSVYPSKSPIDVSTIKESMPVCAIFEGDCQWYRAQILTVENNLVKIRYIDYGNEEFVSMQGLRNPLPEHVTALRPQGLECCLSGYQNMDIDEERDQLLEELILEQDFSMKVIDIHESKVLVELFDSSRYNVSSLLLEKIASARSQVSPLLIQDEHTIEHRKRHSLTEHGNLENKDDARESWRQSKPFRNEQESTENTIYKGKSEFNGKKTHFRDKRGSDSSESNKSRSEYRKHEFRETRENYSADKFASRKTDHKYNSFDQGSESRFESDKQDLNRNKRFSDKSSTSSNFKSHDGDFKTQKGYRSTEERHNYGAKTKDKGVEDTWETNNDASYNNRTESKSGSEKSWGESSEKGWKKGPRTSSRNEGKPKFNKKMGNSEVVSVESNAEWGTSAEEASWNLSSVAELPDLAPSDASYKKDDVTGQTKNVVINWFRNPGSFYCQLEDELMKIKQMMDDIQSTYCNRKPATVVAGAPVIAEFPEDKVLYRAQVIEVLHGKYKVFYVDFGNISTVEVVHPIDRKFMELPMQALHCKLQGIVPPENGWLDLEAYCTFFDKENLTCTFISSEVDCYSVDVFINGNESVAEALITEGLANAEYCQTSQIELILLVGQQIRATVSKVSSISDFEVFVAPDLILPCSIHNLDKATQTFDENLKNNVDKHVIIYVDDVLSNRLEVTVYDTQGYKINIVEPDEGAYDTIDPLCPLPVFYSTLYGWISHVTPLSIYVQPSGYEETLSQLLEQLFQHYENTILETQIVPEPDGLYVVRASDGNWYRAKAASLEDEGVSVCLVDYGNTEKIPLVDVRELEPQFLDLHILAIEIFLDSTSSCSVDKEVSVNIIYTDNGWAGTIAEGPELTQTDTLGPMESIPSVVPEPISELVVPELGQENFVDSEEQPQNASVRVDVILTHVDSPNEFYLQQLEAQDLITNLQADLQEVSVNLSDMESPSAGVLCAAPYSVDQQWYRAQVLDADSDITTVRFVDYGNTDVLNNEATHVKTLPPNLLVLEQYARLCSLQIKPVDEEWSSIALQKFEEFINAGNLAAEIVNQDEKTTYVELYADGKNVADLLMNENLAQKFENTVETSFVTGFVSHLNSASEFWIQFENSVADLEWISEELASASTFTELEDMTPGSLCAAVFPDDDAWYRARILSNTVAGIEVLFIDYGNSCICQTLRALPEELVMMPAMALKSSLVKPLGIEQWTPLTVEKFKEISADGATIFNVRILNTGETSVVELSLNGEDVSLMLLPNTVDCYVTVFESLDSFYIKKHDEDYQLETSFKLESLPGTQWADESHEKFETLNNGGQTIFQVEFVTSDTVRLYINHRDIRQELNIIKAANSSVTGTPKKCLERASQEKQNEVYEVVASIINDLVDSIGKVEVDIYEAQCIVKDTVEELMEAATKRNEIEALHIAKDTVRREVDVDETESIVKDTVEELMQAATRGNETEAQHVAKDAVRREVDVDETQSIVKDTVEELMQGATKENEIEVHHIAADAVGRLIESAIESYENEVKCAMHDVVSEMVDEITQDHSKSHVHAESIRDEEIQNMIGSGENTVITEAEESSTDNIYDENFEFGEHFSSASLNCGDTLKRQTAMLEQKTPIISEGTSTTEARSERFPASSSVVGKTTSEKNFDTIQVNTGNTPVQMISIEENCDLKLESDIIFEKDRCSDFESSVHEGPCLVAEDCIAPSNLSLVNADGDKTPSDGLNLTDHNSSMKGREESELIDNRTEPISETDIREIPEIDQVREDSNSRPSSRPSSRNSSRFNVDDRVVPAAISRPHTPELESKLDT